MSARGWSLSLKLGGLGDAHERAVGGLPYSAYTSFLRHSTLTQKELLPVTRRRAGRPLRPGEAEHLLRLAGLFEAAVELFEGDVPAAVGWLRSPNRGLGRRSPLEMARTGFGARMVEDLIGRLEHGVFA